MKRIFLFLILFGSAIGLITTSLPRKSFDRKPIEVLRAQFADKELKSVDHSRFEQLSGPFTDPSLVTAACISCHNGRHREVMKSSHWKWERLEYIEGVGIRSIGKKNILNNFCIGINSNEAACNKCHIGYGYENADFDFDDSLNVDCLACHDRSDTYQKGNGLAGMPDPSVDLAKVAQSVGKPTRTNCGTCHFFGGGGNNVKHGDLDMSMFAPPRDIDVHMAVDGANLECVDCHTAENHKIKGKLYSVSSMNRNRLECSDCHGELPHSDPVLDNHSLKVACQTCHIPTYAKVNATKLEWDWSTAGRLEDGKPIHIQDDDGNDLYSSLKGSFKWGKNISPEYAWFNGKASHHLIGDVFDPAKPLVLNRFYGSYSDPNAKIIPLKIHRSKQIYDAENRYLIQPKTYSRTEGDGGYWAEFDWQKASTEGMEMINLAYSGKYDFVRTEMNWPVNHMVAPASKSVTCSECHTRENGRLAALTDFYLPGRDTSKPVERAGKLLISLTLIAVLAHGIGRLVFKSKSNGGK